MYSRGCESYHSKLHNETTDELQRASLLAQVGSAAACIMPLVFASGDSGSSTSSGNYKVFGNPLRGICPPEWAHFDRATSIQRTEELRIEAVQFTLLYVQIQH